jgi:hypothetical protein
MVRLMCKIGSLGELARAAIMHCWHIPVFVVKICRCKHVLRLSMFR